MHTAKNYSDRSRGAFGTLY